MTNLRKRLDNVFVQLEIISKALEESGISPPCCLESHDGGKISCGTIGPLSEKEFLEECRKCRAKIKKTLVHLNLNKIRNP
jgi:hypothetical protein